VVKKRTDSPYIHTENEEKVLLKVKTITTNFGDERRKDAVVASFRDHHRKRKVITSPENITHKGKQTFMTVTKLQQTGEFVLIATPSAIMDGVRGFVVDQKLIAGPVEKWTPQTIEEEPEALPEKKFEVMLPPKKKYKQSIWETKKLKKMRSQPLGSPVELTQKEADQVVKEAAGRWKKGRGRPVGSRDLKPRVNYPPLKEWACGSRRSQL